MRNNKGVTMIALVLTISVLLVILSVTLSSVIGEQSVLERTKEVIELSELKDLNDFWRTKIVDVDVEKLNFDRLEDVLPEDKIPEKYRGKLAVKNGQIIYREDAGVSNEEKAQLLSVGITKEFINDIDIKISAAIGLSYDTKPLDLVLVIDGSSHMDESLGDTKKYKALVSAMNNIIQETMKHPLSRVAVVEYSDVSTVLLPLNHYTLNDGTNEYFKVAGLIPGDGEAYAMVNPNLVITGQTVAPTGINNYIRKADKYQGLQLGVARGELIFKDRTETTEELAERVDCMIILGNTTPNKSVSNTSYDNITNIANGTGAEEYFRKTISLGIFGTIYTYDKAMLAPYYTYEFIKNVVSAHSDLKLYSVNFATDPGTSGDDNTRDDYAAINFIMNPTSDTFSGVESAKKRYNYVIATYKNASQELYDKFGGSFSQDSYVLESYNDKSNPAVNDSTKLAEAFKNIFESTKVDLGPIPDTEFEVITTNDKVIIGERLINDDKTTNERVVYKADDLHKDRKIKIKITPALYNATTGTLLEEGTITEKTYTYDELNKGLTAEDAPTIIADGYNITWDVQADFDETNSAGNNLRRQVLDNSGLDAGDGEVLRISSVEIVIPVYEESRNPLN